RGEEVGREGVGGGRGGEMQAWRGFLFQEGALETVAGRRHDGVELLSFAVGEGRTLAVDPLYGTAQPDRSAALKFAEAEVGAREALLAPAIRARHPPRQRARGNDDIVVQVAPEKALRQDLQLAAHAERGLQSGARALLRDLDRGRRAADDQHPPAR